MTSQPRIFQKDLISLRQFTYAAQYRHKCSIVEAADLVYELLAHNPEVGMYTVGNLLPIKLELSEYESIVLGTWDEHWWEKVDKPSDRADCYGIELQHAVRLLDFFSEEFSAWAPHYEANLLAQLKSKREVTLQPSSPAEQQCTYPLITVFSHSVQKPPLSEPLPKEKGTAWEGFDPDAPNYPLELDIALQAWRAVSNDLTKGRVKERLDRWIRKAYPKLPDAAVARIVGVCNWDKAGGRPKIDQ